MLKLTLELIWNSKENKVTCSCDLTHLGIDNRGYYMVTRGSECYVLVARTISHEWVQQMSEVLFLPRKYNICIFGPTELFRRFSEDNRRLPKKTKEIRECFDHTKVIKDCQKRPKEIQGCFDHTPTNFSLVKGQKKNVFKNDIFTCEHIISILLICYHLT